MMEWWNDGMMEYWTDEDPVFIEANFNNLIFLYLILVKGNFTIIQFFIFPKPNIPVFQYSNIPIMSEAN